MSDARGRDWRGQATVAAIAALVVGGIALRFVARSDLWLDEALSVNIARLPVRSIPGWLRHDGAPPLYYLMLGLWQRAFGAGDTSVRALSGVASVGALGAAWFAAKEIVGRRVARIALTVLVLNPYAIRYATETRMYALVVLLSFLALGLVGRAVRTTGRGELVALAIVATMLLYTHYWAAFFVGVGAAGFLGASAARADSRRLRNIGLAFICAIVAFIPWVPTMIHQTRVTGTPWGNAIHPLAAACQTVIDFSGFGGFSGFAGWLLLAVTTVAVFTALTGRAADGAQPVVRWVAAGATAAFVVAATVTWVGGNAFQGRYAAIIFPVWVLTVAFGIAQVRNDRFRIGIVITVVVLGAIASVRVAREPRTQAGTIAAVLKANAAPTDVVVYCPDQTGVAIDRVHQPRRAIIVPTSPRGLIDWEHYQGRVDRVDPRRVARFALRQADRSTVWLVTSTGYASHRGICPMIEGALGQRRRPKVWVREDPDIHEHAALVEFRPEP